MTKTVSVKRTKRLVNDTVNNDWYPSPEDLNKPPTELFTSPCLFYGPKGVGKSSVAGIIPGASIAMWERGRRNLPIRQIPKFVVDEKKQPKLVWDSMGNDFDISFLQFIKRAIVDDSVKLIVIDTVDAAYTSCIKYKAWEEGMSYPSGDDAPALWGSIAEEFTDIINIIGDAKKGPLLISHDREKEITSPIGETKYSQICPTCTPACWKILMATCNNIFYLGRFGDGEPGEKKKKGVTWTNQRVMQVAGSPLIEASNQIPDHFLDPNGEPIELVSMGTSPNEALQNLQSAFNNEIYDLRTEPENNQNG